MLIALALVALLGLAYWFAWRPLPLTSGEIEAPVAQAGSITRDGLGVPHIQAASVEDAVFLQGYATAQDRLWQMDMMRRAAVGELSEVVGRATLEVDREARRLRIRRIAAEHAKNVPPEDRRWLAAYARGVNWYIERQRGNMPLEFTLMDYAPRPWTVADTVAIGIMMYRDLTTTWKDDLAKAALLSGGGDPKLLAQLFPARIGPEVIPGSNAWAISGKLTASGKPLLANDPHLQWGVPSTWHMAHLAAPGLNVAGVTLPGVPGIVIGHNDRIAWGVTNLGFDVQDFYVERLQPQTGQYLTESGVRQAQLERDLIVVKDGNPVPVNTWVTRHGPVWSSTGAQSLALKWAAAEPGFQYPFLQLNAARSWEEFRAALRRYPGPGQNFVYADTAGNIGYQATGLLPQRTWDSTVPVDGASGRFEWGPPIPFEELPSVFNPPLGMVVTANQNPFPPGEAKYAIAGQFDPGYRAAQIRALLSSRKGWKPEDMATVQKDVYSAFLHGLARELVAAAEKTAPADETARSAVELLRGWNGQMEKGLAAPMIAQLVYLNLRRLLVERASGTANREYLQPLAPAIVESLVRSKPREWFPRWEPVLMRALVSALEDGRATQGRDVRKWNYGRYFTLELKHPVVSRIPWIGGRFTVGPEFMSGSSTTVKQTTARLGPSMRFVADTSDWNRSLNTLTLGESGHVLSSHYKDQWKAYYAGTGLPMPWSKIEGAVLRVSPLRQAR